MTVDDLRKLVNSKELPGDTEVVIPFVFMNKKLISFKQVSVEQSGYSQLELVDDAPEHIKRHDGKVFLMVPHDITLIKSDD